ncbi:PH domain-containing protein [Piscibacillus sp. B03]|uniref:PH domain-containing protein n=1 Tax=Piscibacillus sp. B03 TaxID=3457430 RepID=UPI003FCE6F6B
MSNPKRLSPLAIVFNVFKLFRKAFYLVVTFSVLAIGDGYFKFVLLGLLGVTVLFIIFGILSWLRFTYEVSPDQIHIKHGVIIRKDRYISRNRIQSIDLTQGIFHRPFGLTKVNVETAGNDKDVDANLSAVTYDEGIRIQDTLKEANEEAAETTSDQLTYPSRTISKRELLLAGATSGSIGVILSLFGVVFSQVENIIPEDFYDATTRWFLSQAIETLVIIALVVFIILWGLGILGSLIKYGDFKITRYEDELFITRGLLEKKQMTIPLKRIQAVGVEESIIRQPLGLATIYVVIAGGEIGRTADAHTLLFPIIRKRNIESFLVDILPEYQSQPDVFNRVPKRALPYYLIRALVIPVVLLVVALIFFQSLWVLGVIILVASAVLGFLRFRDAGYGVQGDFLCVRHRILSKDTVIMQRKRIQVTEMIHHLLHRKQGLISMKFSILSKQAGRHLWIKELDQRDHDEIVNWFEK